LPTIAGARSLSTDADTATERAACVLVVPMTVLEFTFDADRSTRMWPSLPTAALSSRATGEQRRK
jgi:hypothetical protein